VGTKLDDAIERVMGLAEQLGYLNPILAPAITIGWWRDSDRLFLDAGLALPDRGQALTVARVFRQRAVALVGSDRVQVVTVDAGPACPGWETRPNGQGGPGSFSQPGSSTGRRLVVGLDAPPAGKPAGWRGREPALTFVEVKVV